MSARKLPNFDSQNLAAARDVLAEPERYGGEGSGLVKWARMVVERIEGSQILNRHEPVEGKEEQQ